MLFQGKGGLKHILLENILCIMLLCICSLAVEAWFLILLLLRTSDPLFGAPDKALQNLLLDEV